MGWWAILVHLEQKWLCKKVHIILIWIEETKEEEARRAIISDVIWSGGGCAEFVWAVRVNGPPKLVLLVNRPVPILPNEMRRALGSSVCLVDSNWSGMCRVSSRLRHEWMERACFFPSEDRLRIYISIADRLLVHPHLIVWIGTDRRFNAAGCAVFSDEKELSLRARASNGYWLAESRWWWWWWWWWCRLS